MNDTLESKLNSLKLEVIEGTTFLSDNEEEQFIKNKKKKFKLLDFILEVYSMKNKGKLSEVDFNEFFNKSINILKSNTGCAEDLEILEMILDRLYDNGLINSKLYEKIVSDSSVGRWL